MNRQILLRLLWKEYRTLRPLWLGMAGITVVVVFAAARLYPLSQDLAYNVAIGMAGILSLLVGAVLFAAEKEASTDAFYSYFHPGGVRTAASKIAAGTMAVATLAFFAAATAWGILKVVPHSQSVLLDVTRIEPLPLLLELFACGLIAGALTKSPLSAASFGAVLFVLLWFAENWESRPPAAWHQTWHRWPLALLLTAAGTVLASRWPKTLPQFGVGRMVSDRGTPGGDPRPARRPAPRLGVPDQRVFGRLCWQTWRRAWLFALVTGVAVAVLEPLIGTTTDAFWYGPAFFFHGARFESGDYVLRMYSHFFWTIPLLFGAVAFRQDWQRPGVGFLMARGIRTSLVWGARLLVWGVLAILASGLCVVFRPDLLIDVDQRLAATSSRLPMTLLVAFTMFAFGQCCSFLIRQPLIAALVAFMGGLFVPILTEFAYQLYIPLWFAALPFPVSLLVLTRVGASDAFVGRSSLRTRLRSAAIVAVPLTASIAGICIFRAIEIPSVPVVEGVASAAEDQLKPPRVTIDFRDLPSRLVHLGWVRRWEGDTRTSSDGWQHATDRERETLEKNRFALTEFEKHVDDGRVPKDWLTRTLTKDKVTTTAFDLLAMVAFMEARRLESEGKLQEAWRCYSLLLRAARSLMNEREGLTFSTGAFLESHCLWQMRLWTFHAKQTPALLQAARAEIDADEDQKFHRPSRLATAAQWALSWRFATSLRWQEDAWRGATPKDFSGGKSARLDFEPALFKTLMPFERERSKRLARLVQAIDWSTFQTFTSTVQAGGAVDNAAYSKFCVAAMKHGNRTYPIGSYVWHNQAVPMDRWLENTFMPSVDVGETMQVAGEFVAVVQARRTASILAALLEYKRKNGGYPPSLSEVPGIDPAKATNARNGIPIHYHPRGLREKMSLRNGVTIPIGAPLLYWETRKSWVAAEFAEAGQYFQKDKPEDGLSQTPLRDLDDAATVILLP